MARKRTDSKENAAQIMAKSAVPITVPSNVTLSETDIPFYHNVIGEFARSQWTENALEIAAMMARTMHDLDAEQKELREEGYIAVRENGTTAENPRTRIVKYLTLTCYFCIDHWASTREREKQTMLQAKRQKLQRPSMPTIR